MSPPKYNEQGELLDQGEQGEMPLDEHGLPVFGFAMEDEDPSVVALRTDSYEDSNIAMDPRRRMPSASNPVAPEVNPGAWRERAFAPRGTMPKNQIVKGLERVLQLAELQRLAVPLQREELLGQWMPFLRQAVEQLGGDGLDSHLTKIFKPPGRTAKDKFLGELCAAVKRLHAAATREALISEAKKTLKSVQSAFTASPRRLSLKVMENELEGRIDVAVVLPVLFATRPGLEAKREQVDASTESIRSQLRSMPGHHPDGMMWNYARLKMEKRLIEAELAAR